MTDPSSTDLQVVWIVFWDTGSEDIVIRVFAAEDLARDFAKGYRERTGRLSWVTGWYVNDMPYGEEE